MALKGIRYEPPPQHIEIGGLDLLVRWIEDLEYRLSSAAEAIGLPYPRGVMLAGVPGTGKTFSARAISAILGYPLFALSIDYVIEGGGLALPKLLTTIESCAPCILFVDEIEKLFGAGIDRTYFGNIPHLAQRQTRQSIRHRDIKPDGRSADRNDPFGDDSIERSLSIHPMKDSA